MTFFLKILNESRTRQIMRVNGYSGGLYNFQWDGKLRAYVYHPKKQEEVDDLFKTTGRSTSYLFAPVNCPAKVITIDPTKALPPETNEPVTLKAGPEKAPLDDKLTEGALLRGVIVTDEDTNEVATRLIAAYDKGAQDALNNLTKTKKPRTPKV